MGKPGANQGPNKGQQEDPATKETETPPAEDPNGGSGGDDEVPEEFQDPKKGYAEIKKLRAESAKHRTSNNALKAEVETVKGTLEKLKKAIGGEEETPDPEVAVSQLQQQKQLLEVELGIKTLAIENGISKDQQDYFGFLMSKELESLGENEDLSDEKVAEIVKKAKAVGGGQAKPSSSGVSEGNPPKQGGSTGEVTADKFAKMSLSERAVLYNKDSATYNRLLSEAKEKRLL